MSTEWTALLGRRDRPTDAIEDYCCFLKSALEARDIKLVLQRVSWEMDGWSDALRCLKLEANRWCGRWVLVQYTALGWSSRGFPLRILCVLRILKSAGARIGVVFHDVEPYQGTRLVDAIRRTVQIRIMRRLVSWAESVIFTVPIQNISWLTSVPQNATFIPVGPNLPIRSSPVPLIEKPFLTVGVFSITGDKAGDRETDIILKAIRHASRELGKIQLSVFGRHAELREAALQIGLRDLPVVLRVGGVADPEQIVDRLLECDVLLFVRGGISSRRSSAIAGIACGLPIVAFSGTETAAPITNAGVVLVSPDEPDRLNNALVKVLSDNAWRADLATRSRATYLNYFAWSAIAVRFSENLRSE